MRDAFLDLVYGGTCLGCARPGRLLCRRCDARLPEQPLAVAPDPVPPGLAPCVAATEYGGVVRAMILRHKEDRAFGLAAPLGRLLALAAQALVAGLPPGAELLLVPVPSRPAVVRSRGHDPMARVVRVAVTACRCAGVPARASPLLRQRGSVADQSSLDAEQRAANLEGAFAVRPSALTARARRGRPALAVVCDDVLTTGSTAREAQRALEAVGVPVAGIAVIAATRLRR